MDGSDLVGRLERVYASLEAAMEADLALFKPKVVVNEKELAIYQDFVGDLSEADVQNAAFGLIHNIANLRDNVSRWAEDNSQSFDGGTFIAQHLSLCLIQDLSNADKHGFPLKRKRWSGRSPLITDLRQVMRIVTPGDGGVTVVTFTTQGPKLAGQGKAYVAITGRIVDGERDEDLGDLLDTCNQGLSKWEAQLSEFGVL